MIFNKSFGRYRLAKKLATGGMADLFLAVRQGEGGFEQLVVIKSLLPHLREEAATRSLFLEEGRIGGRLSHPNIVRMLDVELAEGQPFLVLEYVAGGNLDDLIRLREGRPLELDEVVRLVADAANGLAAAHGATDGEGRNLGIVHRDISPHNLLVSKDGITRLFDFGIAQTAAQGKGASKTAGKSAYMSPEQCRGHELDGRSDLFALGVVFHELLSGRRLFARDSYMASLRAITEEEIAPPSAARAEVPPELDAIVLRLLEREPEDRFGSAAELVKSLELWVGGRSSAAREGLARAVATAFADDLAEAQAVATKVIAAPLQTQATVDLANYRYSGSVPAATEAPAAPVPAAPVAAGDASAALASAKRQAALGWGAALLLGGLAAFSFSRPRPAPVAAPAPVVADAPAAAAPAPVAEATGAVRVVYEPADAVLFVDGAEAGKQSPADIGSLAIGKEHSLRLERAGFETIFFPFTLDSTEVLEIQLQLATAVPVGKVDFISEPAGAEVWVAGNRLGVTPLTGVELAANKNFVVEFRRAGAPTVRRAIFVRSGANPPVSVKPAAAPGAKATAVTPSEGPAAPVRKPLPKKKNADGKYPLLTE